MSYELALVERDDGRSRPDYLAVNPLGRVPAYVDGDLVLWESAAIVLHLAEAHAGAGLLPAPGTVERAVAVRWLVYLTNTVQAAFMDFAYPNRLVGTARRRSTRYGKEREPGSTRPSITSTRPWARAPTCSARPSAPPTCICSWSPAGAGGCRAKRGHCRMSALITRCSASARRSSACSSARASSRIPTTPEPLLSVLVCARLCRRTTPGTCRRRSSRRRRRTAGR